MDTEVGVYWVQEALTTAVVLASPLLAGALVIGLVIAILQAATTIQEMTLSYVPKMAVVVALLFFLFGFMLEYAVGFAEQAIRYIPTLAGVS